MKDTDLQELIFSHEENMKKYIKNKNVMLLYFLIPRKSFLFKLQRSEQNQLSSVKVPVFEDLSAKLDF